MSRPFIKDIAVEAARLAGVGVPALLGDSLERHLTRPRHRAMWAARQRLPDASWASIGRVFGRDHSTVYQACAALEALVKRDPVEAEACAELLAALNRADDEAELARLERRCAEIRARLWPRANPARSGGHNA